MRSSEFFLKNNITAFRTKGNLNCICKLINTFFKKSTCINIEFNLFCHIYINFICFRN